ncbi:type VI secretion system tube protein Hcp [Massilia arenae]|uniref:Type VI secretion system tube protein Hcp n=1 Tax=Massilia arenae TaxID=2603288 RepID=A0A5C7FYN5_9BURK|nr:type VI secretion system tube protein Hcp [Massilia arenae]
MAIDAYLRIDGIKGESQDEQHRGWIECYSVNFGVDQPRSATASTAGGHTAERAELDDVLLSKLTDMSTPILLQYCAMGKTIPKAVFEFMRADGDGIPVKYFEMELENVLIGMVKLGIRPGIGMTENICLKFSRVKWKARSGSPTSNSEISGRVRVTVATSQAMSSIATRTIALCALLLCSMVESWASTDTPPRILREPVFGLRYESAKIGFERLPPSAIASCPTLSDDENGRAVWYVFGKASDSSNRTYYVIGGYEIRTAAPFPHQRYQTDGLGIVFSIEGSMCTIIDSARQVFDDRLFDDELPQPILKLLAHDVTARLVRAFGGADRLETEFANQRIDRDTLPPELAQALQPYLTKSARR